MTEHFTHAGGTHSHRSRRNADNGNASALASAFVPALLLSLAVAGGLALQTLLLAREYRQLSLAKTSLQPQEQVATRLRSALDALATSTAKLAADGNANARVVVQELRKRGVTINPTDATKAQ